MQDWTEIEKKVGNWYQVAGTRHYTLDNGGNNGTRVIDVRTGGGLEYSVVADRGLDISLAAYKGINLVYLGTGGEANPAFYESRQSLWLRQFFAGLLTTCGPDNIGPPCVDEGVEYGLHGRFSNTPARNVCDLTDLESERGMICIRGEIDCSALFSSRLRIRRQICSPAGSNRIIISDKIRNCGGQKVPLAMLYHINCGYPLLDDDVEVAISSRETEAYDAYSRQFLAEINRFAAPDANNAEKNYLHRFAGNSRLGSASVTNSRLGIKLEIRFELDNLPFLTQWKMEGIRDYVLGLEPANCPCLPRDQLRASNLLPFIDPGEERVNHLEIEVGRC